MCLNICHLCGKVSRVPKTVISKSQKKKKTSPLVHIAWVLCLDTKVMTACIVAGWGVWLPNQGHQIFNEQLDYCSHCRKMLFGGEQGSVHTCILLALFFVPKTRWAGAVSGTMPHSWGRSSWEIGTVAPWTETGTPLSQHAGLTANRHWDPVVLVLHIVLLHCFITSLAW